MLADMVARHKPNIDRLHWVDGRVSSSYADDVELLGMVSLCSTTDNGWNCYDMTALNAAQTGQLCIGHYAKKRDAKDAVEDYWRD